MVIDKSVVKNTPLCCYGFIIFLITNVYLLWGVALPSSQTMALTDYDAVISPFRLGASGAMALTPLTIFVIELFSKHMKDLIRKSLFPCAAIGSVLGLLSFITATLGSQTAWLYGLSGVLVGLGNSSCFLLWGIVLARMTAASCIYILLFSGVGSGCLNLLLFLLPSTLSYSVISILLILSLFGLQKSLAIFKMSDMKDTSLAAGKASNMRCVKAMIVSLGEPLLCICALGLAFNAFREIAFAQIGGTALVNAVSMIGLIIGTGSTLLVLIISKIQTPEVARIYPFATLIVAACMIPFPFVPANYSLLFVFVISAFYLIVETLFKGTMASYIRTTGAPSLLVLGFGFGVEFTMMGIGSVVGAIPRAESGENQIMYVLALALMCMYFLVIPLASIRRKRQEQRESPIQEHIIIRSVDATELQLRCETIAKESAITPSELPVMVQLAMGKTVAAASRELGLSENTIRSHSKSIYRKLNVHSKQELIDLVGRSEM